MNKEQTITKQFNGRTYTTGETWKSYQPSPYTVYGVIVGFTQKGTPLIELESGGIETLNNPLWIKVKKNNYFVYRNSDGRLCVTDNTDYIKVIDVLHEFVLEE